MDESTNAPGTLFDNPISCEWYGTKKAAAILDVTPNALRIMVHRGQIQAYHLGRRLRFRLADLRAALHRKRS